MIPLCAQTGQGVLNESPTKEEFEATVYCDNCFNDLEAYERKQANLKAQVIAKGVTVDILKENFFKMEDVANYWKELANKKPQMKDVGFWPKLWLFLKGVGTGVILTAVGIVVFI